MSDEDEYQARKAFPVDGLLKSKVTLKPGEVPSDAIEYLRFVAHEASQCDDVVVAVIDEKKLRKQTVVYTSGCESKDENPYSLQSVDREWKICQVSDFSNVRFQLAKMKESNSMRANRKKDFPPRGDPRLWCKYCLGSEVCEKIYGSYKCKAYNDGFYPPLASVICSMDQPSIEKVLEYHAEWLQSTSFTVQQGRWIYSLMAGLELPLTPDVCSTLRALARTCADIRDKLASKGEETFTTALNLIICLVSKYFRQLDLENL